MGTRKVRKSIQRLAPTLQHEKSLWDSGIRYIAGIDEVGKGAWAGPLTIVAAIIPRERRVYKIRDSKLLKEVEREELFDRISDWCETWSAGHASSGECDELGMSEAQKLATRRAIEGLSVQPEHVLIDGNWDFVGQLIGPERVTKIVKGDLKCLSIASASILAKVTRDRMMREFDTTFPQYMFGDNKGYPSPRHIAALESRGPCSIHRQSWAFMDRLELSGFSRMKRPSPQGTLFTI
jgi:ribonuclease HII